jgi:hypothetical protein
MNNMTEIIKAIAISSSTIIRERRQRGVDTAKIEINIFLEEVY